MRGTRSASFATVAAVATITACAVQAELRSGTPATAAQSAMPSASGGLRSQTSDTPPASKAAARTELRAIAARDLAEYRALIMGEDDRIVVDPKLVDAKDNLYTRNHKERVAALEKHAAQYDVLAMIASHTECEAKIETILNAHAEEPIRQSEDDSQFATRKKNAANGLSMFRRALGSPSDVTEDDLKYTYRLLGGPMDASPRPSPPQARTKLQQEIDAIADRGICNAKYVLVVGEWWKRHRVDLDAKRNAGLSAKQDEARKAVLDRRFAPVRRDCGDNWRATSTTCAELPGLSDEERKTCTDACAEAAQDGFRRAFTNAATDCFVAETNGPKECELKKPAASTIEDAAVTSATATCKTQCAGLIKQAKEEKVKDKQECLAFCRDLKSGFCAFTERPKPVCVDRCIRLKCSGD